MDRKWELQKIKAKNVQEREREKEWNKLCVNRIRIRRRKKRKKWKWHSSNGTFLGRKNAIKLKSFWLNNTNVLPLGNQFCRWSSQAV